MRRRSRVGAEVVLGVREMLMSGADLLVTFNVEVSFTWSSLCSLFLEMFRRNFVLS